VEKSSIQNDFTLLKLYALVPNCYALFEGTDGDERYEREGGRLSWCEGVEGEGEGDGKQKVDVSIVCFFHNYMGILVLIAFGKIYF